MARMYSRHKGKSGSKHFPVKRAPRWLKYKRGDVVKLVIELAKQKHSSAMIGTILRDQHAIPDVKVIAGKTISEIMKENKLYQSMPEDLMNMLAKVVKLHDHMSQNKMDKHSLRSLQNMENRIRRLSYYYKRQKIMPEDWKYKLEEARLIIQKR